MAARMRFAHQAFEELKKEDPETKVTEHYIRKLIKTGAVPSVLVGKSRRLINYDKLLHYLENTEQEETRSGRIRKIHG